MNTATYPLNTLSGIFSTTPLSLVRDAAADVPHHAHNTSQDLHLKALVKSGDYFAELATQLDSVCSDIQGNDAAIAQLQRLVRDLLQLQEQYDISPK